MPLAAAAVTTLTADVIINTASWRVPCLTLRLAALLRATGFAAVQNLHVWLSRLRAIACLLAHELCTLRLPCAVRLALIAWLDGSSNAL